MPLNHRYRFLYYHSPLIWHRFSWQITKYEVLRRNISDFFGLRMKDYYKSCFSPDKPHTLETKKPQCSFPVTTWTCGKNCSLSAWNPRIKLVTPQSIFLQSSWCLGDNKGEKKYFNNVAGQKKVCRRKEVPPDHLPITRTSSFKLLTPFFHFETFQGATLLAAQAAMAVKIIFHLWWPFFCKKKILINWSVWVLIMIIAIRES